MSSKYHILDFKDNETINYYPIKLTGQFIESLLIKKELYIDNNKILTHTPQNTIVKEIYKETFETKRSKTGGVIRVYSYFDDLDVTDINDDLVKLNVTDLYSMDKKYVYSYNIKYINKIINSLKLSQSNNYSFISNGISTALDNCDLFENSDDNSLIKKTNVIIKEYTFNDVNYLIVGYPDPKESSQYPYLDINRTNNINEIIGFYNVMHPDNKIESHNELYKLCKYSIYPHDFDIMNETTFNEFINNNILENNLLNQAQIRLKYLFTVFIVNNDDIYPAFYNLLQINKTHTQILNELNNIINNELFSILYPEVYANNKSHKFLATIQYNGFPHINAEYICPYGNNELYTHQISNRISLSELIYNSSLDNFWEKFKFIFYVNPNNLVSSTFHNSNNPNKSSISISLRPPFSTSNTTNTTNTSNTSNTSNITRTLNLSGNLSGNLFETFNKVVICYPYIGYRYKIILTNDSNTDYYYLFVTPNIILPMNIDETICTYCEDVKYFLLKDTYFQYVISEFGPVNKCNRDNIINTFFKFTLHNNIIINNPNKIFSDNNLLYFPHSIKEILMHKQKIDPDNSDELFINKMALSDYTIINSDDNLYKGILYNIKTDSIISNTFSTDSFDRYVLWIIESKLYDQIIGIIYNIGIKIFDENIKISNLFNQNYRDIFGINETNLNSIKDIFNKIKNLTLNGKSLNNTIFTNHKFCGYTTGILHIKFDTNSHMTKYNPIIELDSMIANYSKIALFDNVLACADVDPNYFSKCPWAGVSRLDYLYYYIYNASKSNESNELMSGGSKDIIIFTKGVIIPDDKFCYNLISYEKYLFYINNFSFNIINSDINIKNIVPKNLTQEQYSLIKNIAYILNLNKNNINITGFSIPLNYLNIIKSIDTPILILTSYFNALKFLSTQTFEVIFDVILYYMTTIDISESILNNMYEELKNIKNIRNIYGDYFTKLFKVINNTYDNIIYEYGYPDNLQTGPIIGLLKLPLKMYHIFNLLLNNLNDGGNLYYTDFITFDCDSSNKFNQIMITLFTSFELIYCYDFRVIYLFKGFRKSVCNESNLTKLLSNIKKIDLLFDIDKKYIEQQYFYFKTSNVIKKKYIPIIDINLNVLSAKFNSEYIKNNIKNNILSSNLNSLLMKYTTDINLKLCEISESEDKIKYMIDKIIFDSINNFITLLEHNNIPYNKFFTSLITNYHTQIYKYFFSFNNPININIIYPSKKNISFNHFFNNPSSNSNSDLNLNLTMFNELYDKISVIKHIHHYILTYDSFLTTKKGADVKDVTSKRTNLDNISEEYARGISKYININYNMNVSNGFVKLWEIYNTFDLFTSNNNINVFHMCEAPGQWIKCTQHFIKMFYPNINYNWYANSLNPKNPTNIEKYGTNIISDTYGLLKNNPKKWLFGFNNTGDILDTDVLKTICPSSFLPDIITGDAGMSMDDVKLETLQKLDFSQYVLTVIVSKPGSHAIIKCFTPFLGSIKESNNATSFFVSLLYLYYSSFKEFHLYKPLTSRPSSGEFYIICKKFIDTDKNDKKNYIDYLLNIHKNFKENIKLCTEDIPDKFIIQIYNFLDSLNNNNIIALERTYFFLSCMKTDDEILKKHTKCADIMEESNNKYLTEQKFKKWAKMFNW